jgi:hypothetical protein
MYISKRKLTFRQWNTMYKIITPEFEYIFLNAVKNLLKISYEQINILSMVKSQENIYFIFCWNSTEKKIKR